MIEIIANRTDTGGDVVVVERRARGERVFTTRVGWYTTLERHVATVASDFRTAHCEMRS